jgi:hypothetical protein
MVLTVSFRRELTLADLVCDYCREVEESDYLDSGLVR